eukprot:4989268-Pyramimonas_sp.AAC.1
MKLYYEVDVKSGSSAQMLKTIDNFYATAMRKIDAPDPGPAPVVEIPETWPYKKWDVCTCADRRAADADLSIVLQHLTDTEDSPKWPHGFSIICSALFGTSPMVRLALCKHGFGQT